MFTVKTQPRSSVSYQFFKALYCNGHHYLCDFSTITSENKMKYLVDIEIPGEGEMHVEMVQTKDGWQFANAKSVDNTLERELSTMIYNHSQLRY